MHSPFANEEERFDDRMANNTSFKDGFFLSEPDAALDLATIACPSADGKAAQDDKPASMRGNQDYRFALPK